MKKTTLEIILNKDKQIKKTKVKGFLNKIDYRLIWLLHCSPKKFNISQISKKLQIANVNTWKHINKLESLDLIKNPKVRKGIKKYPEIIISDDTKSIINFLKTFGKAVLEY